MKFTFGKYKGEEISDVLEIDWYYGQWVLEKMKNKFPENWLEVKNYMENKEKPEEDPEIILFGRHHGMSTEDLVYFYKSYCVWLFHKEEYLLKFPKTHTLIRKLFLETYDHDPKDNVFFYVLFFKGQDFVKVGQTKIFIPKRIHDYTHTKNIYRECNIDYKKSFAYRTNDVGIEKRVLDFFSADRDKVQNEKLFVSVGEVNNYIYTQNTDEFYYSKKVINDLMPFGDSESFKKRKEFQFKINEYLDFENIYEDKIIRSGLKSKYFPNFSD